jgi:hypothetical protein
MPSYTLGINQEQLSSKLKDYNGMIRVMAAMFYISKRGYDTLPAIFHAWKTMVFESKAARVRNMLSNSSI